MPRASAVIPAHNAEATLAQAVRSVLEQTVADVEVIVVDDGSTDGTGDLARGWAERDARVRVVQQANRRLAGARNAGIRAARGECVGLLDADDWWMPRKLERHLAHLDADPGLGLSYSHSLLVDEAGRSLNKAQTPPAGETTARDLFLYNPLGNGSTPVLRREALDDLGAQPFDEGFRNAQGAEDMDCWLRLAATTRWRIACRPEILTAYRLHPGAMSLDARRMLASRERVVQKARGYAPDLVARWDRPAKALYLRYLAGRAVRARQKRLALTLVAEALATDLSVARRQPRATALTLGAALALRALPEATYDGLERAAGRALGRFRPSPALS